MADTCKTSQTAGKHLIKRKIKPDFRQTLKPLNVKYRKVHFLKAFKLMQVKRKKGFPCPFSIFYISLPVYFTAAEIEPEFSGSIWVAARRSMNKPDLL